MSWQDSFQQQTHLGALWLTIGLVQEVEDPDGLGRVKVTYPLLGEEILSDWIRVASLFAGSGYGTFFQPKQGNEVLVGFLHGNVNMPYIVGSLYNGQDQPPVAMEQQQQVGMIRTPGGHEIILDDSEESPGITIKDASDNQVHIDSEDGKITISAGTEIAISADGGKISLNAATISVNAEESFSVHAGEISMTAEGTMTLKGSLISLN